MLCHNVSHIPKTEINNARTVASFYERSHGDDISRIVVLDVIRYATFFLFTKITSGFTAVIELSTGYEIGDEMSTFIQLGFKQPVLTVYFFCFCNLTQSHNLQIRKRGTGPQRVIFPFSFTKSQENSACRFKKFTYIPV